MNFSLSFRLFSYEYDRMNNSGNSRNYRDPSYQQSYSQVRADNYNNPSSRRGNDSRPRRGGGGNGNNSYRTGTQSDAGTGG